MISLLRFLPAFFLAAGLVGTVQASVDQPVPGDVPFIEIKASGKTMEEAVADLKRSIADNNYVFIRQQALDMGLVSQDSEDRNIVIVYFCNFGMLDSSLKVDKHVGVYLPCRVTLIREADGVRLVVMNPKFVGGALGDKSLAEICERLAADYRNILNEASL